MSQHQEEIQLGTSIVEGVAPPDRSSSASAPPALGLATESLFAFRVEYAKIFSGEKDIRCEQEYSDYYVASNREKKLPQPLEAIPFVYTSNTYHDVEDEQDLDSHTNNGGPIPRRLSLPPFPFPSAETPLNAADFIWKDEEPTTNGVNGITTPPLVEPETVSPRSSTPCRYYKAGYCSRGDKCFFAHDPDAQIEKVKPEEKRSKNNKFKGTNGTTSPNGKVSPTNVVSPRQEYLNFEHLIGKIYLVSTDQQGCRFLQKKLEEKDQQVIEIIFSEVYEHITELMIDPFGNYLCQKLLEHCTDDQRLFIVERVAPELVNISKNMHGTRAVQKMIECLSSPEQVQIIIKVLSASVVELIQDLNGNHVIQRCLNCLSSEDNQFIYDAVTSYDNCVQVATHRHGCCVLQRCIDHASDKQKIQLTHEITKNALTLVQDPYGNYVVQYILDLPFPELVEVLASGFYGNIRKLATQKFSSNVIEKCLNLGTHKTRVAVIREILSDNNLLPMLQDPFANYVVQTALGVADAQLYSELAEAIRPHLPHLRSTPYGKRIISKLAKHDAQSGHKKK